MRGDRQVYAFQNLVLPEGFVEVFQDEGGTLVHARAPASAAFVAGDQTVRKAGEGMVIRTKRKAATT